MSLNKYLAITIRRLRTSRKLSQEELANLSGLHRTYISGIEGGKRNATFLTIEKIIPFISSSQSEFFKELKETIDAKLHS